MLNKSNTPQNRKPLQTGDCWFSASPWSSLHPTCEKQEGRKELKPHAYPTFIHAIRTVVHVTCEVNHVRDLTLKVLVRRQQRRDHIGHWRLEDLGTPTLWRNTYKPIIDKHTKYMHLCCVNMATSIYLSLSLPVWWHHAVRGLVPNRTGHPAGRITSCVSQWCTTVPTTWWITQQIAVVPTT